MPARRQSAGLPAEPTSFVGRRAELVRLAEIMSERRFITVTGAGGVGKSRLALRTARLLAPNYADGVRLIELSALQAPDLLPNIVLTALSLTTPDARTALETITSYLRERSMLLILDTCEHLADACGQFALTVTREAPGVTVLATSRQPLGVRGERTFPVLPLPVPDSGEELAPGDAVDLFVQRAASAAPGFALSEDNRDDVLMICERLAGIPLALELAAVRLRALSLRELVAGFSLKMTTGARRTGVPRHRNLRAAIGWSYELCTDAERTLWRRLSVFAGSFCFIGLTAVCGSGPLGNADTLAEAVDGLVHKSVLLDEGETYRLLDPIREYGVAELDAGGEGTSVRGRYIAYYLEMTRGFARQAISDEQLTRYTKLRYEHANIRGAIEYALVIPGNDRAAVDIATSMFLYWHMAGMAWEGEYWVNRALERCARSPAVRARLLADRAYLLCILGDTGGARADATVAIREAERVGESGVVARAYGALHRSFVWSDDLASASEIADVAERLLEEERDNLGIALYAAQILSAELRSREVAKAAETAERYLGRLPVGELWARGYLLFIQGICVFLSGDHEEGTARVRRAVTIKHELGDVVGTAYCVAVLGLMAADQDRHERAVWLLGAAESLWEMAGPRYSGNPFLEAWHQRAVTDVRKKLDPDRYRQLWERGVNTGPDALALFAVRDVDGLAPRTLDAGGEASTGLSRMATERHGGAIAGATGCPRLPFRIYPSMGNYPVCRCPARRHSGSRVARGNVVRTASPEPPR